MAIFSKKSSAEFSVLPKHLGIIMDGNGRWAKKRGLPRSAGHKAGANVFRTMPFPLKIGSALRKK